MEFEYWKKIAQFVGVDSYKRRWYILKMDDGWMVYSYRANFMKKLYGPEEETFRGAKVIARTAAMFPTIR